MYKFREIYVYFFVDKVGEYVRSNFSFYKDFECWLSRKLTVRIIVMIKIFFMFFRMIVNSNYILFLYFFNSVWKY